MGVMSCSKNGCHNIMCDCYIPSVGYICWDCVNDFKSSNGNFDSEDDLVEKLRVFMDERKPSMKREDFIDKDDFFIKHSR